MVSIPVQAQKALEIKGFSGSEAPIFGFGLADPAPKGYGVDPCLLKLKTKQMSLFNRFAVTLGRTPEVTFESLFGCFFFWVSGLQAGHNSTFHACAGCSSVALCLGTWKDTLKNRREVFDIT